LDAKCPCPGIRQGYIGRKGRNIRYGTHQGYIIINFLQEKAVEATKQEKERKEEKKP
jgi:hypothetical protein